MAQLDDLPVEIKIKIIQLGGFKPKLIINQQPRCGKSMDTYEVRGQICPPFAFVSKDMMLLCATIWPLSMSVPSVSNLNSLTTKIFLENARHIDLYLNIFQYLITPWSGSLSHLKQSFDDVAKSLQQTQHLKSLCVKWRERGRYKLRARNMIDHWTVEMRPDHGLPESDWVTIIDCCESLKVSVTLGWIENQVHHRLKRLLQPFIDSISADCKITWSSVWLDLRLVEERQSSGNVAPQIFEKAMKDAKAEVLERHK